MSEKRANSSSAPKTKVMEKVVKFHNKNQKKKLVVKGKEIANKFNEKCVIWNKTRHLSKDYRYKG